MLLSCCFREPKKEKEKRKTRRMEAGSLLYWRLLMIGKDLKPEFSQFMEPQSDPHMGALTPNYHRSGILPLRKLKNF